MHCDFFKWHNEWVNDRTLMVLNELKRMNENLKRMQNNSELSGEEGNSHNEMSLLKGKVKRIELEMMKLKRSKDMYMISFYVVIIMVLVYVLV